jgi:ABC-2 type transport system permease protein
LSQLPAATNPPDATKGVVGIYRSSAPRRSKLYYYARAALLAAEMTIKSMMTDGFIIFTVLVQPVVIAILALWMLKDKGADAAIFVVVGSGMTGLWSSLLFISGNSITVERWTGTLESLVSIPTPLWVIVLGKNLANVLQSLISMVVGYFLAAALFGYQLSFAEPLLFGVSLIFTVLSFVAFGLLIAPVFLINPAVQAWQNGLEFPVYILCGFLFPIALLPGWTTPISYALAPYWAARALHGAAQGALPAGEFVVSWLMMFLLMAVYLVLSQRLFRIMLRRARIDGTLGVE